MKKKKRTEHDELQILVIYNGKKLERRSKRAQLTAS